MTLRRILGNQSVRLRGSWHRLRTVPMTGFLISISEPVSPATSSDRCVYLGMATWKIRKPSPSVLELPYHYMFIGWRDSFLMYCCIQSLKVTRQISVILITIPLAYHSNQLHNLFDLQTRITAILST